MSAGFDEFSYQRITGTSATAVGDSGQPIALYGFIQKSGGTAGNVLYANGTTASNTVVFDFTGTVSVAVVQPLPAGITFPRGLVITNDTNTSYTTVIYRQVLSA